MKFRYYFLPLSFLLTHGLHAASPVADAGDDIAITDINGDESVIVQLDASATSDSDGDIVSYEWTWAGGSASGEVTEGTFSATDAAVTVTLTVTDAASNVVTDTLDVTAFQKETALFTDFTENGGNFVNGTLAGETLVVSESSSNGVVYRRVGGIWVTDTITDFLDSPRAIDATTFLTGASEFSGQNFSYSLYRFNGSSWVESPVTVPSALVPKNDPGDSQQLLYAVDSQTFLVSDRSNNLYGSSDGRVFVYDWSGDALINPIELLPPGGISAGDRWGRQVGLGGDLIVVSRDNSSGNGSDLEIFRNVAGTWTHEAKIISNDPSGRGFIAFELSIGNGRILVGGPDIGDLVVIEEVAGVWEQTEISSTVYGVSEFYGYKMDDDGEAIIADDERANIILFEKDAASSDWTTATVTEKRLFASDLTPRRELSVTSFNNNLAVASDRNLGVVRVYDTTTYQDGINVEPIANAGADISTTSFNGEGVRVFLNGGLSRDLNLDDVLEAEWTWNGGSASGLQTFATLDPTVTSVVLTLKDGAGGISRDSIDVSIVSPPVISSIPDVTVVDTDADGNIQLQVNGSIDSQDNPIVAWNWRWPGGTFSGQNGVITLGADANGKSITLEVIDSNGLVSQIQFAFDLLLESPVPDIIEPTDGVSLDEFGSSVAISADTAIINAKSKLTGGAFTGATYLSENVNDVWQQLRLANGEATGSNVVIDGDEAFIGALNYYDGVAFVGAARIFENQSGIWNQTQLLEIPETVTPFYDGYSFGHAVAKSGDWLAVSAPGDNEAASRAGSVFLYQKVGGTWTFQQKLLPPAPYDLTTSSFGNVISMRGSVLAIGTERENGSVNDSSVFVYELNAGTWEYVDRLISDGYSEVNDSSIPIDNFGYSMTISDDEILVGAYGEENSEEISGSSGVVYRFQKSGPDWVSAGRLLPLIDTEFGSGSFGRSLYFSDAHLLVGEPSYIIQDGSIRGTGQVHVYRYESSNWTLIDRISVTNEIDPTVKSDSSGPGGSNFGASLAHDGNDMIVGSSNGYNDARLRTGKAYIFQDYAALNPNANFEPVADAGADINVTDTITRDSVDPFPIIEPLGSELVVLDASASIDAEDAIVSYDWSWSGGSATGISPSARFPVGTTTVTLTIADDQGIVNSDTVDVTVSLAQTDPVALPDVSGNSLTVDLPVSGALWRLSSEFLWHADGATIDNMEVGETYQIEIIGFPGSTETISTFITTDSATTTATLNVTLPVQPTQTGTLRFPETEQGFSWRLAGESTWRNVTDNDDDVEDVLSFSVPRGPLRIEFKPVMGYATPQTRIIDVGALSILLNWGEYIRINNFDSSKTFDLADLSTDPNLETPPYQYIGKIRTPLGRGSGTAVADGVVLTAAHLFFDFNGLQWSDVQWFPRQLQGTFQAAPVLPRGILYRTSYAKLVAPDSVDGEVTDLPEDDQEVDFAVLYFGTSWDGGSANFLQSTAEKNWITGTESKHAVGYPQRSQGYPDKGKIFEKLFNSALTPLDSGELPLLYETGEVFGDGGASGSALFVQPEGGTQFYPAAILLAGQGRGVYHIIDSDVTRMIKDGQDAASGNDDVLDNNSSLVTYESLGGVTAITVDISPGAVLSNARWSITPNAGTGFANLLESQAVPVNPAWDSFTISFTAVSGYATPDPIFLLPSVLTLGVTNEASAVYEPLSGFDDWLQANAIADPLDDGDGDNRTAILEYATDGDPVVSDFLEPVRVVEGAGGAAYAQYEVYVSSDADAILYEVKAVSAIEDRSDPEQVELLATYTRADGPGYQTVTDTKSYVEAPSRFVWVEVTHRRELSTE